MSHVAVGRRRRAGTGAARATLVVACAAVLVSGCTDDQPAADGEGAEVLASAKQQLDATPGFDFALSTDELPDGASGILNAEGTGMHQPQAFDGTLTVRFSGLNAEVPVISTGGRVFAKVPPLQTRWSEIEPADYDAPDPAALLDPDQGISAWLTEAEDVEAGDRVRDGGTVVTPYTARLPGRAVAAAIPTAVRSSTFDAEFRIDEDGRMVGGTFTGPFYPETGDVTYDLTISGYGTDREITAP
jgi:lipoprotein LprG